MVKLEFQPFLYALVGLTVCISIWEIAYVQWDYANSTPSILGTSPVAGGAYNDSSIGGGGGVIVTGRSPEINEVIARNGSSSHGDAADRDKAGNRGILSSGRISQDLSGQEENGAAAGGLVVLDSGIPRAITDFRKLIDLEDKFEFLINQPACPQHDDPQEDRSERLVTVLVHSAPRNFRKRLTIRQTWASFPDPALKVYFLLGSVASPVLQFKLEMENERFGDLIQGSFVDAYRNMTYKHVMALKWFTYYCADTPVMLKTDDDVFVNTPALMEYVRENVDGIRNRRNFVNCKVVYNGKVKRSYRSKWRVSVREYAATEYPPYCPGFIVLYSGDAVAQLYGAAQRSRYFWIDDVFVTGTLVQRINATLMPFRDTHFRSQIHRLTEPYVRNMPLFSDPDLPEKDIRKMWSLVSNGRGSRRGFKEDEIMVGYLIEDEGSGAGIGLYGMGRWNWMVIAMLGVVLVSYRILLEDRGSGG